MHRIACPECKYELLYATLGSKGSYKTENSFERLCRRTAEIQAHDALSCTVLRAQVERALREQFPGREISR